MEDRCIRILVDGNNDLGVLHTGQVLDCPRDADRQVKLRGNDLAGLADLEIIGHKTRVHGRPACSQRRAELVGKGFEHAAIVVAAAQATAPRNDDLRRTQLGAFAAGQLAVDQLAQAQLRARGDGLNCSSSACQAHRLEGGSADAQELDRFDALHCRQGVASVDRAHKGVCRFDADHVRHLGHVTQGRHAGQQVLAFCAGRHQHMTVASGQPPDQFGQVLGTTLGILRCIAEQYLSHTTELRHRLAHRRTASTSHQYVDFAF